MSMCDADPNKRIFFFFSVWYEFHLFRSQFRVVYRHNSMCSTVLLLLLLHTIEGKVLRRKRERGGELICIKLNFILACSPIVIDCSKVIKIPIKRFTHRKTNDDDGFVIIWYSLFSPALLLSLFCMSFHFNNNDVERQCLCQLESLKLKPSISK